MMKRIITFAAVAAMIMTMLSCTQTPDLSGKWNVVTINGEELSVLENEDEAVPFIEFDTASGKVHGNTGINIINGSYTLSGNDLAFGRMMSTMMAGPESKAIVEQNFLAAVDAVKSARVKSGILTLYDADGNVLMTLSK